MQSGRVVALHLKSAPGQLQPVTELVAVAGKGFEGDRCFGQAFRQALFVAVDEVQAFGYQAGDLREQLTVELDGLQSLPSGTKLRAGEVDFEIEGDCAPCHGMAKRLGENPAEFVERTKGHRGMLAHVISEGKVRVGDEVTVLGG